MTAKINGCFCQSVGCFQLVSRQEKRAAPPSFQPSLSIIKCLFRFKKKKKKVYTDVVSAPKYLINSLTKL